MPRRLTPEDFAANEYRDYVTYRELAKIETNPAFRAILEQLVQQELDDYRFWLQFSSKKRHRLSAFEVGSLKMMRRALGLTFTAKFLERHEKQAIHNYAECLSTVDDTMKARLQEIICHETEHEQEMINQIKEERVKFLGSIVLGVNDGLIELTGALVGFVFALRNARLAGFFGLVTGVAATLSMASSAYMQARHEEGRDPKRAALYTGTSYLLVVAGLVLPFFLIPNISLALSAMAVVIVSMIAGFSFYASVLFDRNFKRQLGEMLAFSLGVAGVAFLLGSLIRSLTGIQPP